MATLLSQTNLTIERCTTLNPATLLPVEIDREPHDCIAETKNRVLPRTDLTDIPFPDADITMYVDGSCKMNLDGTYAVVTQTELLKGASLPSHLSAQAAER